MRASLLHYVRKSGKDKASEWRRYRLCGIILLFINIALTGIVILVVHQNSGFEYPGMLIYIMAMYAFYAAITAVWNVVKFRRYGSHYARPFYKTVEKYQTGKGDVSHDKYPCSGR